LDAGRLKQQTPASTGEWKIVLNADAHGFVLLVDRLGQPIESKGRPFRLQFAQQVEPMVMLSELVG
jgi:hypothetical protein